jgi:hypothetical protein
LDSSHARVGKFLKKEEKQTELFILASKKKFKKLQIAIHGRF